MFTLITVKLTI